MAALKSLSDDPNIPFILLLDFVECLIQFEIFPVFGLTSDFQLKSGHYVLCVMRLWLLLKPTLVIGFLYPQGK